jgi:hypothetical protein
MNGMTMRVGLGFVAGALVAGCSGEPLSAGDEEGILGEVRSGVTTSQEYRDPTGKLRMTIKTCDWVGTTTGGSPTKQNQATCAVDGGWRMVGGGAEIENQPVNGAYLLASAPDTGGGRSETIWAGRSKGPAAHRLRAYVIQLKIDGAPTDPLDGEFVSQGDSASDMQVSTPSFDMGFSGPDHIFLGGGASLLPPTLAPNGALTDIVPYSSAGEGRLYVRGTMFGGTTGSIKAYTFAIKRCPSFMNGTCLESERRTGTGSTNSGYATVTSSMKWPGVVLGIAGASPWNGGGKFLTDLIPFSGSSPGVTVRSYTNGTVDNGPARYNMISVWAEGSPHSYNAVNFASSGALYRSGSTLQQFGFANSDQHKWHLEPIASNPGRYLLRNGNPGHGGSCAYRNGTNVNVSSTCSGAAYQWRAYRGNVTSGGYSLQNVESSTCLDADQNSLNSFTPKNVVLKACSNTGAWQDVFVSQHDNWPPPQ